LKPILSQLADTPLFVEPKASHNMSHLVEYLILGVIALIVYETIYFLLRNRISNIKTVRMIALIVALLFANTIGIELLERLFPIFS
jgi:hypothetical protein